MPSLFDDHVYSIGILLQIGKGATTTKSNNDRLFINQMSEPITAESTFPSLLDMLIMPSFGCLLKYYINPVMFCLLSNSLSSQSLKKQRDEVSMIRLPTDLF